MNQLILANSKWEALYRKASEDLKNADEMVRRLGNLLYQVEKKKIICSCCFDTIETKIYCCDCYRYQETQRLNRVSGRPVRSTCAETFEMRNELCNSFDIGEAQDRYYTALEKMEEENKHYASVDESAEECERPSVDLFGNIVRDDDDEEMPAWMNDTTSIWKMPQCSALEDIKGYITPPRTPRVLTTPPKLERSKPIISPEAKIHPESCICYRCTYCNK